MLTLIPVSLKEANAFVAEHHRHRVGTSSISLASAQARKLTHCAVPPFPTKPCGFAGTLCVTGHKFSIGCVADGELVGVVIAGRPVSRYLDDGLTLEVTRLCSTGEKNACSILYGAAARAARAMGYRRIITYTLDSEDGTSIRAAGWSCGMKKSYERKRRDLC